MIENARHLAQLYGNYSRFEFHHPGPAFYYLYALGECLLHDLLGVVPAPGNAHVVTSMAVQSAFFALALAMFQRLLQRPIWLPLAIVAAAWQLGSIDSALVSTWPPDVLLMPTIAFLVACTSVASGRLEHLMVMVLAGGFLFHGHVAQSMFVGGLGATALAMNGWYYRRSEGTWSVRSWLRRQPRLWLGAAALAALFALPLVIDLVLHGTRSNVATILARFRANRDDSKSLANSAIYLASFATPTHDQSQIATAAAATVRDFFAGHAIRLGCWATILFGAPLATFALRRRMAPAMRLLLGSGWLMLTVDLALCLLWGMAQAGDMHHFNGVFFYGVYYFGLLLALAAIALAIQRWHRPPLGVAAITIATVLFTATRFRSGPDANAAGTLIHSGTVAALTHSTATAPPLLVFAHDDWPVAASVALELHRRAIGFYVAPRWAFMFGTEHVPAAPAALRESPTAWWLAGPGDGGIPLTQELQLFVTPAALSPDGAAISFGPGGNASRYVMAGIILDANDHGLTDQPSALLRFATPISSNGTRVVFDAASAVADGMPARQAAEVFFAGTSVGRVAVAGRDQVAVTVPAALWNAAATATLALRFPDAITKPSATRRDYTPWLAWRIWSITCETLAEPRTDSTRPK